jgi:hypothetical protein
MAKRRPDPRVIRHATPPTCTLKRRPTNADMHLAMSQEQCSHRETDDTGQIVRCTHHAISSYTLDGIITRYCLDHIGDRAVKRSRLATQAELDTIMRWLVR